ncbi:MAG: M23/M56 family metallopeptidase [Calditrichia bacterium]
MIIETILTYLGWQALYAGIVGCFVWPLVQFFGRRYPLSAVLLWSLVLLRLVVPVDLSSDYSLRTFADSFLQGNAVVDESTVIHEPYTLESASLSDTFAVPVKSSNSIPVALFALWLAGFIATFSFFQWLRRRYRAIASDSKPVLQPDTLQLLQTWKTRLGIMRSVQLRVTESSLAFTYGIIRPVIIIPRELLTSDTQTKLECVIAHEMQHIRHWDVLWMFVQQLLQSVYFFQPLVWKANAGINRSRERLRDAEVLHSGKIKTRDYAETLLLMATGQPVSHKAAVPFFALYPGFSQAHSELTQRLKELTYRKEHIVKKSVVVFAIILFAAVLLPLAPQVSHAAAAPATFVKDATYFAPIKEGRITSSFGKRTNPFTKLLQDHHGVDVGAPIGTPVFAIADGEVIASELLEGYGNRIKVLHADGRESWYAQLHERKVEDGAKVVKGQTIATVGSSGRSTAPHLHFELRVEGKPVDPEMHVPFYHLEKGKPDDDC